MTDQKTLLTTPCPPAPHHPTGAGRGPTALSMRARLPEGCAPCSGFNRYPTGRSCGLREMRPARRKGATTSRAALRRRHPAEWTSTEELCERPSTSRPTCSYRDSTPRRTRTISFPAICGSARFPWAYRSASTTKLPRQMGTDTNAAAREIFGTIGRGAALKLESESSTSQTALGHPSSATEIARAHLLAGAVQRHHAAMDFTTEERPLLHQDEIHRDGGESPAYFRAPAHPDGQPASTICPPAGNLRR